ncbi:tryptophan--tRNA ligase [Thermicanus aegyptius]|uniref:tryptophan--tRNA ligase n=1 Tax=Thermicanus aegyptius TaxID=94009 RepID=UPI0004282E86|nr:tryptophan--tRNA ligase [Thermicanus aegyptius]
MSGKRIFSGVQPSGNLTIGNYLGAIQQFVRLQEDGEEAFYCVVDLHAVTVPQNPEELREKTVEVAALYMACGLNPKKSTLFVQSHVPAHAELGWLLQCVARIGELNRMTQYKEKGGGKDTVNVGLYTYPVLMAADILLYQATHVPVGEDQKQHLELTRDIAERFNKQFGELFTLPEPMIGEVGARIMALDEPQKKMSKSAKNEMSRIILLDSPEMILKKIKRAVTDTENEIRYDPVRKPGISNLLSIYSLFSGESIDALERKYAGVQYGPFKNDLAEVITDSLSEIQRRYRELSREEVIASLQEGAEKASEVAEQTLRKARELFGFLPKTNQLLSEKL